MGSGSSNIRKDDREGTRNSFPDHESQHKNRHELAENLPTHDDSEAEEDVERNTKKTEGAGDPLKEIDKSEDNIDDTREPETTQTKDRDNVESNRYLATIGKSDENDTKTETNGNHNLEANTYLDTVPGNILNDTERIASDNPESASSDKKNDTPETTDDNESLVCKSDWGQSNRKTDEHRNSIGQLGVSGDTPETSVQEETMNRSRNSTTGKKKQPNKGHQRNITTTEYVSSPESQDFSGEHESHLSADAQRSPKPMDNDNKDNRTPRVETSSLREKDKGGRRTSDGSRKSNSGDKRGNPAPHNPKMPEQGDGGFFWSNKNPVAPTFDGPKATHTQTRHSSGMMPGPGMPNAQMARPGMNEQWKPHMQPPPAMFRQNLEFYLNKIRSKPRPGYTIEDMLRWKGDYRQLEINHRYIQWLFPIPESGGMNPEAQPLQEREAVAIRDTPECRNRLMKAYKMMLDFYGMQLVSNATGQVDRCETNWKKRFAHLNKSGHNYLRITRILKALSCFGLVHYQKPWIEFFLNEVFLTKALSEIRHGAVIHWIDSMDDENDRNECLRLFQDYHDNTRGLPPTKVPTPVEESDTDSDDDKQQSPNEHGLNSKVKEENSEEKKAKIKAQTQTINKTARAKRREEQNQNVEFYRNNIKSKPFPGFTVEEMLKWKGQHQIWEGHCCFIQWLFPIPETVGANPEAQALLPHEIQVIRSDKIITKRFLAAYDMMLDLYGMKLESKKTGEVKRKKKQQKRYEFLNSSVEDHKRITRIIEALDCFGFTRFQYPWVSFLINEIYYQNKLSIPEGSVRLWIEVMADDNDKIACASTMDELIAEHQKGENLDDDGEQSPADQKHKHVVQRLPQGTKAPKETKTTNYSGKGVSNNVELQHGQQHKHTNPNANDNLHF